MPSQFHVPSAATQIWVPLQLDPVNPPGTAFSYPAIARLKPGVTVADAERDFRAALPRAPDLVPKFVSGISTRQIMDQVHPVPLLVPLREDLTGGIAGTLWMVAAAGALVLLVACANVANLTLVRADARQREIAVRQALGAGRGRIVLHMCVEPFVIAIAAGGFGLAAAAATVKSLVNAGPAGVPRLTEVRIDASTVGFTFAVTVLVAIACGLLPVLRSRRGSLTSREGGRTGTAGRVQQRVRGGLVAVQFALALVVLSGSGLLIRTFERLHALRPGFDASHVSTFWLSLPTVRYKGDAAIVALYTRLADRVAALPGVQVVGLTSRLPLESHGVNENPLYPEDDPSYATRLPPLQLFTSINGDYFRAMGIPLLAGKAFEHMDAQREGEAIVSRTTAQFFWKDPSGAAALGKRFRPLPTGRWYTVIGVVGDVHDTALAADPRPTVYLPEAIEEAGGVATAKSTMALVVRTATDATSLTAAVREAVRELDSALPLFDVRPMATVVSAASAQLTFIIFVLGGAAAVTLVLGAVGLYGVLAYVVTLRRRELGIRLALGASPRAVAVAMTRYGLTLAGLGVAGGLMIFMVVARFLRAQLFGITPGDPVTLTTAVLTLLAMAVLASWLPARRAAHVDPVEALRAE
jgi:predicted permease